jgi:hypothetical protein
LKIHSILLIYYRHYIGIIPVFSIRRIPDTLNRVNLKMESDWRPKPIKYVLEQISAYPHLAWPQRQPDCFPLPKVLNSPAGAGMMGKCTCIKERNREFFLFLILLLISYTVCHKFT